MNRLAIMQPYLFPYIGYFQLIHAVDKFIIFDDVNYIKRGWVNRNQVLLNGEAKLFTIPVANASQNRTFAHHSFQSSREWKESFQNLLLHAYKNAPQYSAVIPLINKICEYDNLEVANFITHSLHNICEYLEIKTELCRSSELHSESKEKKGEDRIMSIAIKEKTVEYINAIGGESLYSQSNFDKSNIRLKFLKTLPHRYTQSSESFVSNLSIIDLLMNCTKLEIKKLLEQYELV